MILDLLDHHDLYESLHPLFQSAFYFIETCDPDLKPGRYELPEKGMYALVQTYLTKSVEGALFEAHRNFIDIQYIVEGRERVYYAPLSSLNAGPYEPDRDYVPADGEGQPLILTAGAFGIFFPQDAHLPSRQVSVPEAVRKIVVKVPVKI